MDKWQGQADSVDMKEVPENKRKILADSVDMK